MCFFLWRVLVSSVVWSSCQDTCMSILPFALDCITPGCPKLGQDNPVSVPNLNSDNLWKLKKQIQSNRPLALRGHMTNASFKHWLGILLMLKIVKAHKNYLTPEIWEETHLREIFYCTLIFQQSSMISIGGHVGGHTLALHHGGQNYFLLVSC